MGSAILQLVPGGAQQDPAQDPAPRSTQAFKALEQWAQSERAWALPLQDVEKHVCQEGREALRLLMQEHVDARAASQEGAAVRRPEGDGTVSLLTHKRPRTRKQRTTLGPIDIARTGFSYPEHPTYYPLDRELQLPQGIHSYVLQEHLTKAAVRGPYGEASATVAEFTGESVPPESVRALMHRAAEDFESFYEWRDLPRPQETGPILVAAADCKGIPMVPADQPSKARKSESHPGVKKMAVVTTVYTTQPRVRTPEDVIESLFRDTSRPRPAGESRKDTPPECKRVAASLTKGKDLVLEEMAGEVQRRDPDHAKVKVALTDGERALQKRVRRVLPGAILILDLMHALDRIWLVAAVLCGSDSEATAWAKRQSLRVLRGEVSEVVRGVRQSVTKRGITGKNRKKILEAVGYLFNNRRHMKYGDYLAQGLPIASGAVEGACKNLVADRMERSGMRWRADMAEPMLKLRAVYLSGDFDAYWAHHVAAEQARLYPDGCWEVVNSVD